MPRDPTAELSLKRLKTDKLETVLILENASRD
jgi:hypothetical protein